VFNQTCESVAFGPEGVERSESARGGVILTSRTVRTEAEGPKRVIHRKKDQQSDRRLKVPQGSGTREVSKRTLREEGKPGGRPTKPSHGQKDVSITTETSKTQQREAPYSNLRRQPVKLPRDKLMKKTFITKIVHGRNKS